MGQDLCRDLPADGSPILPGRLEEILSFCSPASIILSPQLHGECDRGNTRQHSLNGGTDRTRAEQERETWSPNLATS